MKTINAALVLERVKESMECNLSDQLIPAIRFAKGLPACSGNILEMHFVKEDCCFDFACRLNIDFDKELLSGILMQKNIPPFLREGYSELLNASKTGFRFGIENVWFEYDFPFQSIPALFFDINRKEHFCPEEIFSILKHPAVSFYYSLHSSLLYFLQKIKTLNLYVVYYGFMFSRNSEALRLTINGMKAHNLLQIVNSLGWKGNYTHIKVLLENYLTNEQQLVLSVDFDKHLHLRIGVEVFDDKNNYLITELYKTKIVNNDQFTFLLNWKSTIHLPSKTADDLSQMYQRNINCIYKRVNHIKFIVNYDSVTTKAYLYYCF